MKLRSSGQSGGKVENKVDMTPLIDIIFQLILFLVLTSQITVKMEDVDLPFALEGKEVKPGAEEVAPLIVNIVRYALASAEGERAGSIVFDGNKLDKKGLTAELQKEARYDASESGRNRGWEPLPGGRRLSKLSVLVRADRGVRAEYLREVWQACMDAGIYKVKMSTVQPE